MDARDHLEERAREVAQRLVAELVETAENVDFRGGTYLLAAVAAELGQTVEQRCFSLARTRNRRWEVPAADAESLVNGAWACMGSIAQLSDQDV